VRQPSELVPIAPIRSFGERRYLLEREKFSREHVVGNPRRPIFMQFANYYFADRFVSFFLANNFELYNHRPKLELGPTANRASQAGSAKTCGSGDKN
jgi:hypothetical protein